MKNHHDHSHIPSEVQSDIAAGKALFEGALGEEPRDEHHERILSTLEEVIIKLDDEKKEAGGYLFDVSEFVDACEHVVSDQLSALKKEKLDRVEFAKRFNRWFVFCDAVVNMGISCLYAKDALKDKDYEEVFKTLKINKQFEATFLKPRDIKIALRHKSKQVMDKYPWLAMPVLLIKDEQGTEHEIALTPSPNATVWWLDILTSFHGSYNWILAPQFEEDDEGEYVPTTSIAQPYPEGTIREEEEVTDSDVGLLKRFDVLSSLNTPNKEATYRQQPIRAFGESETRHPFYAPPADYVRSETKVNAVDNKPQSWWKRLWNKLTSFFSG